jgi:hypothetical protein
MQLRKPLVLVCVAIALSSCTTVKEVDGRKVLSTRFENGHVVYKLAPNTADAAAEKKALAEIAEVENGRKIDPLTAK